ncbi:hypothetical protein G7066_06215 [Leucobacter coleopterorum]|uniref:Uncharacterized protein n=1 Tax=Leucobacter coleopterorum TaxID=2714933 RepID=A0ABX6JVM2_9MICO|nr:hypothetical protein [Leucobacter coleopterorum]QIM18343.1 hypothetical protein G7066_06215 [Leucobacter coleopterorum]
MAATLLLADVATRDDMRIFLERLLRAGQAEVRLVTRGSTLAVYGCTQMPRGITDAVPVVLVMRAFALAEQPAEPVDTTVQARAILDRIARLGIVGRTLELPDVTVMAAWAGVLPPTSGWEPAGSVDGNSLAQVAAEGIERVVSLLPADPGEAVVQKVRASVWGVEIAPGLPAAAAFAAEMLGFLVEGEPVRRSRSLTWTRLTTERGHVLVRSLLG